MAELVNCLNCGRDTRSVTEYCLRCRQGGYASITGQINEQRDRPRISATRELDFGAAEDFMNDNFEEDE